jgi:hypothetical protein
VSETHLKPGNIFILFNYTVFREGKGVAVLVRRHLLPSELLFNQLTFIEATAVKTNFYDQGDVAIVFINVSPENL